MNENDTFLRVLPLVQGVVRKFVAKGLDPDEAESEAQLAALRAIRRFDPTRGRLRSLVFSCVNHALQDLAAVTARRRANTVELKHDASDQHDRYRRQIEELLELLTPVERTVIVACYLDGETEEAVATSLSRSRQTINRIKTAALAKMRAAASDDPFTS